MESALFFLSSSIIETCLPNVDGTAEKLQFNGDHLESKN